MFESPIGFFPVVREKDIQKIGKDIQTLGAVFAHFLFTSAASVIVQHDILQAKGVAPRSAWPISLVGILSRCCFKGIGAGTAKVMDNGLARHFSPFLSFRLFLLQPVAHADKKRAFSR